MYERNIHMCFLKSVMKNSENSPLSAFPTLSPYPSPRQPLPPTSFGSYLYNTKFLCLHCFFPQYISFRHSVLIDFSVMIICEVLAFFFLIYIFFIWPHHVTRGISVAWPRIEPVAPAVEARSLNHWTAREVPVLALLLPPPPVVSASSQYSWITIFYFISVIR